MLRHAPLDGLLVLFVLVPLGCSVKNDDRSQGVSPTPVQLKVGHVGHDHHLALFVALDNSQDCATETGISLNVIEDRKLYELTDNGRVVANVQIVRVGGGSKMPTALAQSVIDVGLGGVAPVLAACDSGAPVKLIAPLHSKGDMLVVPPDMAVRTWEEFVVRVRSAGTPLRIGYKSPIAVAKMIFEDALRHEGIAFSGDSSRTDVQVHMINVKGGGKLNVSLSEGLVDGYVGNNPYPAIATEAGVGKVVCDLEKLPPGRFHNHPCCCLAANTDAVTGKEEAVVDLLVLLLRANETINRDPESAVDSACRWIGTTEAVERASIPTSGYSLEPDDDWRECMGVWFDAMNKLSSFRGELEGLKEEQAAAIAYDFSHLKEAKERLAKRRSQDR